MGKVYVLRKANGQSGQPAVDPLQQNVAVGPSGEIGLFASPPQDISPAAAAGYDPNKVDPWNTSGGAAQQHMNRRGQNYTPQQQQNIGQSSYNWANKLGPAFGMGMAGISAFNRLYDQTSSGANSGVFTSPLSAGYGTYQFAKPFGTRAGAHLGAAAGARQAQQQFAQSPQGQAGLSPQQVNVGNQAMANMPGYNPQMFSPPSVSPTPPPPPGYQLPIYGMGPHPPSGGLPPAPTMAPSGSQQMTLDHFGGGAQSPQGQAVMNWAAQAGAEHGANGTGDVHSDISDELRRRGEG